MMKFKAGVQMDEDGKPLVPDKTSDSHPMSEDELRGLSAFTDFIQELDLDDLGQEKPPPETTSPQNS